MQDFHPEIPVGHLGFLLCQRFVIVDLTVPALETQRTQGLGAFQANKGQTVRNVFEQWPVAFTSPAIAQEVVAFLQQRPPLLPFHV